MTAEEPGRDGLAGPVAEAAAAHLLPGAEDIVICGPAAMMARAAALVAAAAPAARLHADPCPAPPGRYDRPRETGCADGRTDARGPG